MISIKEAAKKLEITENSLRCELMKQNCPYGYATKIDNQYIYHVSEKELDEWIKEHPEKYSTNPNYTTVFKNIKLSEISTEQLAKELKRRDELL